MLLSRDHNNCEHHQLSIDHQAMESPEEQCSHGGASGKYSNGDRKSVIIYGAGLGKGEQMPVNLIVMAQNFLRWE